MYNQIDEKRKDLIKYCYFDSHNEDLREPTIRMISRCESEDIIDSIYKFFIHCIYPYFTINRKGFNKLRCMFMKQVLSILINHEINNSSPRALSVLSSNYNMWYEKSGMSTNSICNSQKLISDKYIESNINVCK